MLVPRGVRGRGRPLDGTLAHAFERTLGFVVGAGGQRVVETGEIAGAAAPARRGHPAGLCQRLLSAAVPPDPAKTTPGGARASPSGAVAGRRQASPATCSRTCRRTSASTTCGFRDIGGSGAGLAAGIDAFCYYHYWFNGRPALSSGRSTTCSPGRTSRFPFCLCWANEAWRRAGTGSQATCSLTNPTARASRRARREGAAASRRPPLRSPRVRHPRFVSTVRPPCPTRRRTSRFCARPGGGGAPRGRARRRPVPRRGRHPVAPDLFDFWVETPPHGLVAPKDYLAGGPRQTPPDSAWSRTSTG